MEIPYRYNNGKISPSLTFLGEDSTERRSSLSLPVAQADKIVELHDPIDAVSCNKHQDRIVCAGSRGVLRVFKITDRIIPELDLKKVAAKNKNRTPLLYSPSNVAWSKLRDDLIATTSTIGAVVLWNIDHQRTEIHWKAHTRSATVVRFHRYNENILMSGSKDGCIVYDSRDAKPAIEFRKGIQVTVRDLTFSLVEGDEHTFLSADDGGIVKVWDLRNNDKPCYSRTLHDGYISCIQSHPRRPYEVASGGGRDKHVKIWNWKMNSTRTKLVETYAPVGRINWRPDNEFQFATCAVFTDVSVQVWDTRRPHLPMVSYPGHKDSTTDVFWSRFDPHRFVSVGKDGLAILHNVSEGDWTVDHLCDTQIDLAPDGLMVIGVNSENEMKKKPKWELGADYMQLNKGGTERRREAVARHLEKRSLTGNLPVYEPFSHFVRSEVVVGVPSAAQYCLSSRLFEKYARFWLMGGKSIVEMCEYNAVVCAHQNDEVRERTWRYVAGLMEEAGFQEQYDKEKEEEKIKTEKKWRRYITNHESAGTMPFLPPEPKPDLPFAFLKPISDVHLRDGPHDIGKKDSKAFQFLASLDVDHEFVGTDANMLKSEEPHGDEFCGLPEEAFGMKRYFQDLSSTSLTEKNSWRTKEARDAFTPISLLIKALHFIAHQGDVQLCASIATVAGHKLAEDLSDFFIEAWVQSYMDMLYRLEMYEPIAALRKFTCVKRLSDEGNEGIFVRPLITHARENPAWGDPVLMKSDDPPPGYILCTGKLKNGNCEKCAEPIQPICVTCDQIIEGVVFNCERCNHNMHLDHAFAWFRTRVELVDLSNFERPGETILERRSRLMSDEETEIIDRSQHKCPVPGCRCKCLEEDEDETSEQLAMEDETAGKVEWESLALYKTQHIENKHKKKKDKMKKIEKRIRRKLNLSEKFEIVFSHATYDFEPEEKHKKALETLKAAVQTPEEKQLFSIVKSCLAIPPEFRDKVRQEVFGLPSEDEEEDSDIPLVVRFGLTTMEKVREKQGESPTNIRKEKRKELKRIGEERTREATEHWHRVWEKKPQLLKTTTRQEFFSDREREIDDYRMQKAPQCDVIRCISWGLIQRLYRVERRREQRRIEKAQENEKKFQKILADVEEKKKPDVMRKFLASMKEQNLKEQRSANKFKDMMKNITMHMSGMVNFISMRVNPCFVKKHGRLAFRGSQKARHCLDWNENISKVYRISCFEIRERTDKPEPYYPSRPEPTDLVPNTHDELVRACKINAARAATTRTTASSSGTPRTTVDYQI